MKNIFAFVLLLICSVALAQETEEEEIKEVPFNFLDRFDESREQREIRTELHTVFALGWNQALGNGNGIGDDYRFWGSGISQIGLELTTQLSKTDDLFRFNYGLSLQTQSLRINNNRAFETENDITTLQPVGFNVDRSKFRQVSLIAPLHLEIGRGDKIEYANGVSRRDYVDAFVVGIGGFVGINLATSQELKFENDGRDITTTRSNDFEMENFIYGVSAYAGSGGSTQLFVQYGLNTIFKNSPVDQHHASIGVRVKI